MASMVEALDWLQRMTAESKCDDERVDGWIHKIREGRVDGLTKSIVHERADGLTHKIREELTVGWTLFVDVVQVVTWARTKRRASLVCSTALMTRIPSTVALMVATMVTLVASSRSKETETARGDREGIENKGKSKRARAREKERERGLASTCRTPLSVSSLVLL